MVEPNPTGAADDGANATILLRRIREGDPTAAEDLLPLVYEELRARAGHLFRGQLSTHTLQPTALVHEAYVKLVRSSDDAWKSRAHFCAVAALAMRQILTDRARRRAAFPADQRQGVTNVESPSSHSAVDLLALDDAMTRLQRLDPRQARLVELRFFGGLNNTDIAEVLGTSLSTVEKEWRKVRAWLARELAGGAPQ